MSEPKPVRLRQPHAISDRTVVEVLDALGLMPFQTRRVVIDLEGEGPGIVTVTSAVANQKVTRTYTIVPSGVVGVEIIPLDPPLPE
jgi:hypothetical protein